MENQFYREILDWEEKLYYKKLLRLYKTQKTYKNPRINKTRDYRNRNRGYKYHFDSECKTARKMTNKRFRRKAKGQKFTEHYYKLTPHDYKTYGWITW